MRIDSNSAVFYVETDLEYFIYWFLNCLLGLYFLENITNIGFHYDIQKQLYEHLHKTARFMYP